MRAPIRLSPIVQQTPSPQFQELAAQTEALQADLKNAPKDVQDIFNKNLQDLKNACVKLQQQQAMPVLKQAQMDDVSKYLIGELGTKSPTELQEQWNKIPMTGGQQDYAAHVLKLKEQWKKIPMTGGQQGYAANVLKKISKANIGQGGQISKMDGVVMKEAQGEVQAEFYESIEKAKNDVLEKLTSLQKSSRNFENVSLDKFDAALIELKRVSQLPCCEGTSHNEKLYRQRRGVCMMHSWCS